MSTTTDRASRVARCVAGATLVVLALAGSAMPALALNPVVVENQLTGNPASEWDVAGSGDASIQGFATDISVDRGTTVHFKIKTDAAAYHIDIYRLGYYGGAGARFQGAGVVTATLPQSQPAPLTVPATGLVDCGNWAESAHWDVPSGAVSGVYIARLVRNDTNGASHVVFVVRDDASHSDMFFQTSDATWQAYNGYGGNSLYTGTTSFPGGHAAKVSYNRPFLTRDGGAGGGISEDWVFNAEYPMIRWLEANGFDVTYTTDVDSDRNGSLILNHKAFLSVGHDEYWSGGQRANVEAARGAGVHLAFFSGNEVYWKTRWEPAIDGSGTTYRTLVCYKEGTLGENVCGAKCDPSTEWTGLWRDGCAFTPPSNGCRPENALTGQISWDPTVGAILVPDTYKNMRFWRNTSVAALGTGQTATLTAGSLGYEWDFRQYDASFPAGRVTLSSTTVNGRTHELSLYRHASGALVFGAGTVQWAWGLDSNHDRGNPATSPAMQQATVNLFADMGLQPETLQPGLQTATASTDVTAPVSVIAQPAAGAHVTSGNTLTISGTSSDADGVLAAVEVSADSGATWNAATGTTSWSWSWTPGTTGSARLLVRGVDDSGNLEVPGGPLSPASAISVLVIPPATNCPCTVFQPTDAPAGGDLTDGTPIELGMKFRSSVNGWVTGTRFYKATTNTGTHLGHLWSSAGAMLAEATFTGETASGWQEVAFPTPVAVTANTTYITSYHSPAYYADSSPYFTSAISRGPLRGLADGEDGANGVYTYAPVAGFPTSTFNKSNYWVDVVFNTTLPADVTPPTVTSTSPTGGGTGVAVGAAVTAAFSEDLDPLSVTTSAFLMTGPGSAPVAGTVSYDVPSRTATFTPLAPLAYSTIYTMTLKGGITAPHVTDLVGNPLASDATWSFTTGVPPPTEGPGGPVLVISGTSNPFSRFPVEILRAEGLNEFAALDISAVTPAVLANYDVVVLGNTPISVSDVTNLTNWVNAGGSLIALRPDKKLAPLLGLTDASATLADRYLLANTATGPGVGIVNQTIQYHGAADLYTLSGATSLATLYSSATTATPNPAVTTRTVGSNGGRAIAFTYDLARSVVLTRQGNPAWAGQNRDGQAGPTRSDDMFYGAASFDPQPDWVDFNKIAIPQADEQQRLLANAILQSNLHRKPLPRFWYLPRGLKAAVVMTGDDHANGGTIGRFNQYLAASPSNTPQAVADWTAVRGTSYIYTGTPISNSQAASFEAQGFEVSVHLNTGCADWTPTVLESDFVTQLAQFATAWPGVAAPTTHRTHCIAWSDWATEPKTERAHGIRLDTNYYYWPDVWVVNRPGLFTGSGIPMRFADLDGSLIDCYQVTTQMPDESGESFPAFIDSLLERATGPRGYYGVFCANMHTDQASSPGSDAIVASALARQVPVISARQMLTWLDGRNGSSFTGLTWNAGSLSFSIAVAAGANNLQAMLPMTGTAGTLTALARNGGPVTFTPQTVKGIDYAFFPATAGSYVATYTVDTTPPAISAVTATPHGDGTATVTWTTDEPADSRVDFGLSSSTLNQNVASSALVTSHSLTLTGLGIATTYFYRVTSADAAANSASEPVAPAALSFTTPSAPCPADQTVADFAQGTPDANTMVGNLTDGEVILVPATDVEFGGSALPAGWQSSPWTAGGTTIVGGGQLQLNGARAATVATFGPGHSLEFVATFQAEAFQHVGFVTDMSFNNPWVIFSTGSAGNGVYARADDGTSVPLGAGLLGSPHRYRIDWGASSFVLSVDGATVATMSRTLAGGMLALASDANLNATSLGVDWVHVSPYAASGSYTSRVFDQGATAYWGALSWTASTPTGTSLSLLTRTGGTPVPDGTWTSFVSVINGGAIGGSSRYVQYRADLATALDTQTPVLQGVTIACAGGPDNTAPAISGITVTPAPDGASALVQWTTDEAANSRVDYGTGAGSLLASASAPSLVIAHALTLSPLTAGTLYYFRVTSADGSANTTVSPNPPAAPLTFTTPAPACMVDQTTADFAAGTPGTGTALATFADGEVTLKAAYTAEFTTLPPTSEWASFPWTGGTSTVSGGALVVDGARYNTEPAAGYGPGTSMEFVATFGAAAFQHVGFGAGADVAPGEIFNTQPAVMFSTGSSGAAVIARTWVGSFIDVPVPGSLIGTPHRYRIDWKAASVDFWVDGTLVHSQPSAIGGTMRAAVSDFNIGGPAVTVDWMRVTPYAASGQFASRVYDSGGLATWDVMAWTADTPAGTSLAMQTRHGNTPVPDGTWSAFAPLGPSGSVAGGQTRYFQYRADLATSDPTQTPVLKSVSVACVTCANPAPPVAVTDLGVTIATPGTTPGLLPLRITFTPPPNAASFEVYRAPFGGYPRYDDAGGTLPATPAYPPGSPWVLTPVSASGQTDNPPTRDSWSYVVFSKNACGIPSAVSNRPVDAPNYRLGDVSDGVTVCAGDNQVGTVDITLLGAHYGLPITGSEAWACLDIGPTLTGSVRARPLTDGVLDFEDLVIFALNYGLPGAPGASARPAASPHVVASDHDALVVEAPDHVEAGELFTATLRMTGTGRVRGLSAQLAWDAAVAAPAGAGAGAMLEALHGTVYSARPGRVDAVVLGSDGPGLAGEGVVAIVTFRAVASGKPAVAIRRSLARDAANQPVSLAAGAAAAPLPSATALDAIAPNPVQSRAVLSFSLARDGPVDLSIYGVDGRRIASPVHGMRAAGVYRVDWDGAATSGARVAPGMYYVRLTTAQGRQTRTMIVLR